jgi:hypothetical protein
VTFRSPVAAPAGVGAAPPSWALSVDHLTKRFGGGTAVDDVTFHLAPGEALAIIGPNGAGKSSLVQWVSVNGTDDLLPDAAGCLSSASELTKTPTGFARVGVPVRAAVTSSGVEAVYVYFGQIVYGPGKAFARAVKETIQAGRARIIGSGTNHLPLTHVQDAAALIHLLSLQRSDLVGRTVVVAPGSSPTQRKLYTATATALGRTVPKSVPTGVAALVAGRVNVEIMTLNAHCTPDLLTTTGVGC